MIVMMMTYYVQLPKSLVTVQSSRTVTGDFVSYSTLTKLRPLCTNHSKWLLYTQMKGKFTKSCDKLHLLYLMLMINPLLNCIYLSKLNV